MRNQCVKIALHAKVESKAWIIDSRCSNCMTIDKGNFIDFKKYDGGFVKFVGEEVAPICGKWTISIDGKCKTDGVCYVKGSRHNLLSVSQMCSKGYKLIFHGSSCEIRKGSSRRLVVEGIRTNDNV